VKRIVDIPHGMHKYFINGFSLISLTNNSSRFNIPVNILLKEEVARLCGFTHLDVKKALNRICKFKTDVQEHLARLMKYAPKYHFCNYRMFKPMGQ